MANRQRAEARRKAAGKGRRGEGGGSKIGMWIGLGRGRAAWASAASCGPPAVATTRAPARPTPPTGDTGPRAACPRQPAGHRHRRPAADVHVRRRPPTPRSGIDAPMLDGLNFHGAAGHGRRRGRRRLHARVPRALVPALQRRGAPSARLEEQRRRPGRPATSSASPRPCRQSSANYPPAEWFSNKGWAWPVMVDEAQGDGAAGKAAAAYGATGLAVLRHRRRRRQGEGPRVGRGRGRPTCRPSSTTRSPADRHARSDRLAAVGGPLRRPAAALPAAAAQRSRGACRVVVLDLHPTVGASSRRSGGPARAPTSSVALLRPALQHRAAQAE